MIKVRGGDGGAQDGTDLGFVGTQKANEWLSNVRHGPTGVSGKLFVILACASVIVIWVGLSIVFARWKANYEALAKFGREEVAPAVLPLEKLSPSGVAPEAWRSAVEDTKGMLLALTAAGLLDQVAMTTLRDDLRQRVAGADSRNAVEVLTKLWNDMEQKAGKTLSPHGTPVNPNSRHAARIPRPARPGILPPSPRPIDSGVIAPTKS